MVDELTILKESLDRLHKIVVELDMAVTGLEQQVKRVKKALGMED